jgi:tripartite-type tricarboxylate transporter receptor subunit TctC
MRCNWNALGHGRKSVASAVVVFGRAFLCVVLLGVVSIGASNSTRAQDYPSRPITMVMGIAPGGIMDTAGRLYAQLVSQSLGQNVLVENRPGAAAAIAASYVQNATPDGYTIILLAGAQHATVPQLQTVSYDPIKGLAPISVLFNSAALLTIPVSNPATSISGLVEYARTKPGGILFGTPGVASPGHLLAARIAGVAKMPAQFVHYRGAGPMMSDLVTGRIEAGTPSYPAAVGFFTEKKLRALAVDSSSRLRVLPDVPTLNEVGLGEAKIANWFGIAAPAATPLPIINKLRAEFTKAAQDPELIRKLEELGIIPRTTTSEEMQRLMTEESETMSRLIPDLNIKN